MEKNNSLKAFEHLPGNIEKFTEELQKLFSEPIKVGQLKSIDRGRYVDSIIGVVYLIYLKEGKNGLGYDDGHTACLMIHKDGEVHYELNNSFSNFWPIYYETFKPKDAVRHLTEIEHFLLKGEPRYQDFFRFMSGKNNDRLQRVFRAEQKCAELKEVFGVDPGGAAEG